MHRTIVVGSPRENGRSASLAREIFDACIEECPQDGVSIVSVASLDVASCAACDACATLLPADSPELVPVPEKGDPLMQVREVFHSDARQHKCVIEDDMAEVRKHLDAADELIVVSPVYFSGPPAQFKALLDRMQPYFWSDLRSRTKSRRPMTLHVVGEGGDPYGYLPLVGCVRSAFGVAGFSLERVLDWVGKINADGTITGDADEYDPEDLCLCKRDVPNCISAEGD